jgi:hypothetical protein
MTSSVIPWLKNAWLASIDKKSPRSEPSRNQAAIAVARQH